MNEGSSKGDGVPAKGAGRRRLLYGLAGTLALIPLFILTAPMIQAAFAQPGADGACQRPDSLTIDAPAVKTGLIGTYQPSEADAEIVVEAQEYIDRYFEWKFEKAGENVWIATFTIDPDFWNAAKAAMPYPCSDQRWTELKERYLSGYDDYDAKDSCSDLKNLKGYPLRALTKGMEFSGFEFDAEEGKGSFSIAFNEGFSGMRAVFGFGSTYVSAGYTTPMRSDTRNLCRTTGALHAAWQKNLTNIAYAKSLDNGTTWAVNDTFYRGTSMTSPTMDCEGDNITVAAVDNTPDDIFVFISKDEGSTWARYSPITADANTYIAAAIRGDSAYLMWYNDSAVTGDEYIDFMVMDIDDGSAKMARRSIYTQTGASTFLTPAMVVSGSGGASDKIFAAFVDDFNDDVYFINSTDSGATFGTATAIMVGTYYYSAPSIAYNGSTIYIVGTNYGTINISNSTNGGSTWGYVASPTTSIQTRMSLTINKYGYVTMLSSYQNPTAAPTLNNVTNYLYDIWAYEYNGASWSTIRLSDADAGYDYVNTKPSYDYGGFDKYEFLFRKEEPYGTYSIHYAYYNATPYITANQTFASVSNGYTASATASDYDGLDDIISCKLFHVRAVSAATPRLGMNPANSKTGTYNDATGVCTAGITTSDQSQMAWDYRQANSGTGDTQLLLKDPDSDSLFIGEYMNVRKANSLNGMTLGTNTSAGTTGALSVEGDILYAIDDANNVTSYNKTNMRKLASRDMGTNNGRYLVAENGFLYVGDSNNNITKINASNFADIEWSYYFGTASQNVNSIGTNITDPWAYTCHGNGNVSRVNKTDGSLGWTVDKGALCAVIAYDDYDLNGTTPILWSIVDSVGQLFMINATSGATIFSTDYGTNYYDLAVDDDFVYLFGLGNMTKVNKTDKSVAWSYNVSTKSWYSGDVDSDYLYARDNYAYLISLYKSGPVNYTAGENVTTMIRFQDYGGAFADSNVTNVTMPSGGLGSSGLSCSITAAGSCSFTKVLYLKNDTAGYMNAHAENVTPGTYPYVVCCESDYSLSYGCGSAVLKLSAATNAHAQRGDYSGPGSVYGYSVCLDSDTGSISCTYADSSCPATRECLASMAGASPSENNDTDAHVGPCDEYERKICCGVVTEMDVTYVSPTPAASSRQTANSVSINVTVEADPSVTVDTCILEWNGANETMEKIGSGYNVTCNKTKATADGTDYAFKVYANDTSGTTANETSRTFRENDEPAKVSLSSPANQSHTTDRTPAFAWEEPSDADGDTLNYTINITCFGGCSDDNRLVTDIVTNSYTPSAELQYFGDDNYYYNWSVRAGDDYEFGEWSDQWKLTVDTNVSIVMLNDTVDFGENRYPSYDDDTSDNSPYPFSIRNTGNCIIDVNLSASDLLWDSVSGPSAYFTYKAGSLAGEEGAFNWSGSQTDWANVPETNTTFVDYLNYTSGNSSFEVDMGIEVPSDEPPGSKTSTIIFAGEYHRP